MCSTAAHPVESLDLSLEVGVLQPTCVAFPSCNIVPVAFGSKLRLRLLELPSQTLNLLELPSQTLNLTL